MCARSARDRSFGCPARSSCPRAVATVPVGQNSELKLRAVQGLLPLNARVGAVYVTSVCMRVASGCSRTG